MAEKWLQTSSLEGISCTLQTYSVFSGNESEYLLLAPVVSAKKFSKKASSTKLKSSSHSAKTKPKKESADKRLDAMEKKKYKNSKIPSS